jgi:nitrate/TMAO reductase-like tetraheme cytochrome c subunit
MFGKTIHLLVAAALALCLGAASAGQDKPPYEAARWDPRHFKPLIDKTVDAECLQCHAEVLAPSVRKQSPAGLRADKSLAWYQTLDTYAGTQDTFHRRHLVSDYAKQVMALACNTCHQGHDSREEAPGGSATAQTAGYTLRKQVDPKTCLMCHGQFNWQVMGLPGPWKEHGETFGNNCLTCHAGIRTSRHQVNFLKAKAIEAAGQDTGDVCYGCHGGRAWYRINFPYPRHAWEGMDKEVPDWARGRPSQSEPRFLREVKKEEAAPTRIAVPEPKPVAGADAIKPPARAPLKSGRKTTNKANAG